LHVGALLFQRIFRTGRVQHEDEIMTADVTVRTSGPDVTPNAFRMSRAMSISPCVDARVEAGSAAKLGQLVGKERPA
jgi:hypothetical protein